MKKNSYKRIVFAGIVLAVVLNIELVLGKLGSAISVFSPLIVGCVVGFILNLVMRKWEKVYFPNTKNEIIIKSRRAMCILLSFLSVILILYLVISLILPQLRKCMAVFIYRLPLIESEVKNLLLKISNESPELRSKLAGLDLNADKSIDKILSTLTHWSGSIVSVVGSVFGVVANIVMALIIAIYIVAGKERLKRQGKDLINIFLPEKIQEKLIYILDIANSTFSAFFAGQFIEAIILGTLCSIGLFIFRFPYAPMIGSVIGLTALVPLVGAYIGGTFGFLIILTVSPVKAFFFIIFLVVLQQIEGNLIYPKVVGGSVGLPGIWVLVSIIIAGGFFGLIGVFFSVPVMATIYKLLKNKVNEEKLKKENEVIKENEANLTNK